jgi:hypothetical protein
MTTKEILIAARKLINKPQKWTRGALARNNRGKETPVDCGTRFCAEGALRAVTNSASCFYRAHDHLSKVMDCPLDEFNDGTSHKQVMRAFSKAIKTI